MRKTYRLIVLVNIFIIGLLISNLLIYAQDNNQNKLHAIWHSLGRKQKVDLEATKKIIKSLLPITYQNHEVLSSNKEFVDYEKISEIISLLKSKELAKRYIDFIIFSKRSADELRSYGLGKLYTLQAPIVLNILSNYSPEEQDTVINNLAWGLANIFYPHVNTQNYSRLIICQYWELHEKEYQHRELVERIEKEVYFFIKNQAEEFK